MSRHARDHSDSGASRFVMNRSKRDGLSRVGAVSRDTQRECLQGPLA